MEEVGHLVEDGNISGMPVITKEDVRWTYDI
jgi:hypothetical protein